MRVDAAGLRALLRNRLVAAVQEDHMDFPTLTESVEIIGADQAAAAGINGAGVTVAIIDTGVQSTHPFLSGKVVNGACFSGGNGYGATTCPNGQLTQYGIAAGAACTLEGCQHGTHVAGIAAGSSPSMTGVASGANILAYNVFSWHSYYGLVTYESDYIKALDDVYALRSAYNISSVNMSLGGGGYTRYCDSVRPATKKAIDRLRGANIATIIATGNSGYINGISAPACISTAISVGSTDKYDGVSDFSNYSSFMSLLAPGESIYSSVPGGGYAYLSGTSMATPHVTGAWAVLRQAFPTKSVSSILSMLKSSGTPVRDWRTHKVKPRIDLANAIGKYRKPTQIPTLLSPADGITLDRSTVTLTWQQLPLVSKYKVVIKRNGTSTAVSKTYKVSDVCSSSGDTCSVNIPTILKTAMHTWTVQPYSSAGSGPVSLAGNFYTPTTVPGAITLTTPLGSIGYNQTRFEWDETAGPFAAKYYFKLYKSGKRIVSKTYEAYKICSGGHCVIPAPTTLKEGVYSWTVQPWNPVGYAPVTTGNFDFFLSTGYSNSFDTNTNGMSLLYPTTYGWWLNASRLVTFYGMDYTCASAKIDGSFSNIDVSAVMHRDGDPGYSNGIVIRGTPTLNKYGKDWKNGYEFLFNYNGKFGIWKDYNGKAYNIQPWTVTSAINTGGYNTLRVRAFGTSLNFYINGVLVWSGAEHVSGPDLKSGSVGIVSYVGDWSVYEDYLYTDSLSTSVPLTLSLEEGEETVSAEQLALNEEAAAHLTGSPAGPGISMEEYESMLAAPGLSFEEKMQRFLETVPE
jgi:subtilisin family serine protease